MNCLFGEGDTSDIVNLETACKDGTTNIMSLENATFGQNDSNVSSRNVVKQELGCAIIYLSLTDTGHTSLTPLIFTLSLFLQINVKSTKLIVISVY